MEGVGNQICPVTKTETKENKKDNKKLDKVLKAMGLSEKDIKNS